MRLVIRACSMCSLGARQDGQPVTDEHAVEVLGRAGVEVSDRLCPEHARQYQAMVEDYLDQLSRRKGSGARGPLGSRGGQEGPAHRIDGVRGEGPGPHSP